MKTAIVIFLLFLFACHSGEDKTIAFLNEGIQKCNSLIFIQNNNYLADFEAFTKENPKIGKPVKVIIDTLCNKSGNILKIINQKKVDLLKSKNHTKSYNLLSAINEYKNLVDSLFSKDSIIQTILKKEFDYGKSDFNENDITEINLLENKIQNLNFLSLKIITGAWIDLFLRLINLKQHFFQNQFTYSRARFTKLKFCF